MGKKLCPCRIKSLPGATVALPLSERPGAKAVRLKPIEVSRIIGIAARNRIPRGRQPGDLP